MKGWLKMTKVGRLFEEEKIEYAKEYAQEYAKERLEEREKEIARKMLAKGIDILTIMELTMLSKSELLSLQNNSADACSMSST
jgi:predicted transposase YdaD